MKTRTCAKCSSTHHDDTRLCRSCWKKQWRASLRGRICPSCNEKRNTFKTKSQCNYCYWRKKKASDVGVCCDCKKQRRVRPSSGRCLNCHIDHKHISSPRVSCGQCGVLKYRFLSGLCRDCYLSNKRRARKYGLSASEYMNMLSVQNGKCAICSEDFSGPACVDHDHESGFIRALLCYRCNAGIGALRDNPLLLRIAAGYLETNRSHQIRLVS